MCTTPTRAPVNEETNGLTRPHGGGIYLRGSIGQGQKITRQDGSRLPSHKILWLDANLALPAASPCFVSPSISNHQSWCISLEEKTHKHFGDDKRNLFWFDFGSWIGRYEPSTSRDTLWYASRRHVCMNNWASFQSSSPEFSSTRDEWRPPLESGILYTSDDAIAVGYVQSTLVYHSPHYFIRRQPFVEQNFHFPRKKNCVKRKEKRPELEFRLRFADSQLFKSIRSA